MAFSPDGKKIAAGLSYGTLNVWDIDTRRHLRTIIGQGYVSSVAFSPDGKNVISGSDRTIRFWDVDTGQHLRALIGHTSSVISVVFSPDGKTIASGSIDGTVLLWDVTPSQLPEDINKDGVVNIQDLVLVANGFGTTEPDLNGDGVVNIQDLVMVALAFGNMRAVPE